MEDTSWEKGASWYDSLTTKSGHYYHKAIILPKLKQLIQLEETKDPFILDVGCGQGILARTLCNKAPYLGLDNSQALLSLTAKYPKKTHHRFMLQDATEAYDLNQKFSHVIFLLSLQNMRNQEMALIQASRHMRPTSTLILVLNHPVFRIPRQSFWEIDRQQKIQYRRINRYSSPLTIPIQIHPGKKAQDNLWAFHFPLATYFEYLRNSGLCISDLQEWYCPKKSMGKNSTMENNARKEFPLFLTIVANPFHQVC